MRLDFISRNTFSFQGQGHTEVVEGGQCSACRSSSASSACSAIDKKQTEMKATLSMHDREILYSRFDPSILYPLHAIRHLSISALCATPYPLFLSTRYHSAVIRCSMFPNICPLSFLFRVSSIPYSLVLGTYPLFPMNLFFIILYSSFSTLESLSLVHYPLTPNLFSSLSSVLYRVSYGLVSSYPLSSELNF